MIPCDTTGTCRSLRLVLHPSWHIMACLHLAIHTHPTVLYTACVINTVEDDRVYTCISAAYLVAGTEGMDARVGLATATCSTHRIAPTTQCPQATLLADARSQPSTGCAHCPLSAPPFELSLHRCHMQLQPAAESALPPQPLHLPVAPSVHPSPASRRLLTGNTTATLLLQISIIWAVPQGDLVQAA